jgi:hypothetical protein
MGSERALGPNLRKHSARYTKAGPLKLGDSVLEVDKSGLLGFIENGKRAGNPHASANGLLPPCLFVYEQHIGMDFLGKRNGLALAQIKLPQDDIALWAKNLYPGRRTRGPFPDCSWCKRMLEFRQNSRRNKNSPV